MLSRAATTVRFEALRDKIFEDMENTGVRWRTGSMLPLQLLVLLALIKGGAPKRHVIVHTALVLAFVALHILGERLPALSFRSATVCTVFFLATLWNTGGVASPLLITGLPLLLATAMIPRLKSERRIVPSLFLSGLALSILFARSAFFAVPAPFAFEDDHPSRAYVGIVALGALMTVVGLYVMGRKLVLAYERIAIELAARRDDAFEDNEDRARSLEGITTRIAHEVKNPLAAIKGLSTHMARTSEDPKVRERLTVVANEADRIQTIVDGFVSFSRGLDDLVLGPVRPHDIATDLGVLMELRAEEASVNLAIEADAKKLKQALLNLLLNALQASPPHSEIQLQIGRASCGVVSIRIIDHGPGMSPEIQERIKKPYFTTKQGGSGLGVAVARTIVLQHGGKLYFESSPGKGTTAVIELEQKCSFRGLPKFPKLMSQPDPVAE
jgi:two-component system, NtrC family, sensor histidine kinase HydH